MKKYPQKIIPRAFLYIRTLEKLIQEQKEIVSSKELAMLTGLTDVQIRKDISNFKKVGTPRVGYKPSELKEVLEACLPQETVHVSFFGVGNLGMAIMKYPKFHTDKITVVNAFDIDKNKIGTCINGVEVYSIEDAPKIIPQSHAEIGIIAVPQEYSQKIADIIVSSGLCGIVNFSPTSVIVPPGIMVKNIDLTIDFLSFFYDIKAEKA